MFKNIFQDQIPNWSLVRNPFHYQSRASETLLITVGDSWTYGDSLGKTKVRLGIDDINYRVDHVYGNILSKSIAADWINLALPGISNYLMLSWIEQLLPLVNFYETVVCIVTLTESGRHEELALMNKSKVTQHEVLVDLLSRTYNKIQKISSDYKKVKFITAHNFTDPTVSNTKICEQSWLEVLTGKSLSNDTHIVVSEHIAQMNYDKKFPDVLEIIARADARVDILDSCQHCNPGDTRHPTEDGHALWANYLLGKL